MATVAAENHVVKFSFNGGAQSQDVVVNQGEEIRVELKANPTTGYLWAPVMSPLFHRI